MIGPYLPNMRKIDKSDAAILSTQYRDWEQDLEKKGTAHPAYNSSKHRYYIDIVMNLLHCQNGLCAYTEVELCALEDISVEKWSNGRYLSKEKINYGALDHFDEKLKYKENDPNSACKDWLWSNFFVVHSDTNNRKGAKPVDYLIKPDSEDYDPFKLLEYSPLTHKYVANPDIEEESVRLRITKMIEVLGLNAPKNLVDKRRTIIERALRYGTDANEREFPTAFEFYKKHEQYQ